MVLAVLVSLWRKYQEIGSVGIRQVTHILTMDTIGGPSLGHQRTAPGGISVHAPCGAL